jgi:hypothetical protein
MNIWTQSAVNTQNLFINQGGQSKAIETLRIVSTTRTGHWRFHIFANKNEYAGVPVSPVN